MNKKETNLSDENAQKTLNVFREFVTTHPYDTLVLAICDIVENLQKNQHSYQFLLNTTAYMLAVTCKVPIETLEKNWKEMKGRVNSLSGETFWEESQRVHQEMQACYERGDINGLASLEDAKHTLWKEEGEASPLEAPLGTA